MVQRRNPPQMQFRSRREHEILVWNHREGEERSLAKEKIDDPDFDIETIFGRQETDTHRRSGAVREDGSAHRRHRINALGIARNITASHEIKCAT